MDKELLANMFFNITVIGIVLLTILYTAQEIKAHIVKQKIEGSRKVNTNKEKIFKRIPMISTIYSLLEKYCISKAKGGITDGVMIAILVGAAVPLVVFGIFGQYLLMVLTPLAILKGAKDILKDLDISDEELIQLQLPRTIDNIIKTSGRHDNIQVALSEASINLPNPMKGELEDVVRKMNSQDRKIVLEEFRDRYNNPWIRSFVFILVSLVEDAERKTALYNLHTLRSMVEQEHKLTMQSVGENRSSVMQNYIIVVMAILASIIVMFTEIGRSFYFDSGTGLFSLLAGYGFIYLTVKMNINMSSRKEAS